MMYVAYRLGGFSEAGKDGDLILLRADPSDIPPLPVYVQLTAEI
jgi:hypothetical protein